MDYLAAVRRDATAILELRADDPARPIPSCPEWTATDLWGHVLDTFRGEIEGFGDEPLQPAAAVERAVALLTANGSPFARDLAHECAVHRWDAEAAFGQSYAIDPDLAADGIDEFFEAAWPMLLDYLKRPAGTGQTVALRPTDGPPRRVVILDDRPRLTVGDGPADVEVAATASDLLLWLWGRSDPPPVTGDRSVLESMRNPHGRYLSPGF